MPFRLLFRMICILGWLSALGVVGCSSSTATLVTTLTSQGVLTPFFSRTPTATHPPTATPIPKPIIPTTTPLPTPTPFIYTIQKGDTLGGLALRYGLTIAQLEAANPALDPNFLTIGITITIPLASTDATPTPIPTPTPVRVALQSPVCYLTAEEGAWCLALAHNEQSFAVEGLSAWISLTSTEEGSARGQLAGLPLNVLPAGASLPVLTFFEPPLPDNFAPRIELLTALPAIITDTRYLTVTVEITTLAFDTTDSLANVRGKAAISAPGHSATRLWLATVAYDDIGRAVGVRRWETSGNPLPQIVPFEVTVYSLGPKIAKVEVVAEATP